MKAIKAILIILIYFGLCGISFADVSMPRVYGDHMVLQRDMPIRFYGWSDPDELVTVSIEDVKQSVKADSLGIWKTELSPMKAGGPYTVVVSGKNRIEFHDVLIGEVWFASGQSNMSMALENVENAREEIKNANHPMIRLLHIPCVASGFFHEDVKADWTMCDSELAAKFSAIPYFFARHLQKKLDVPVGIVVSAMDLTLIHSWIPIEGYQSVPRLKIFADRYLKKEKENREWFIENAGTIERHIRINHRAVAFDGNIVGLEGQPCPSRDQHSISALYKSMVYPVTRLNIRGCIWYQGESAARFDRSEGYFEKMQALINGWRTVWRSPCMPFFFVQIAPNKDYGFFKGLRSRKIKTEITDVWDQQIRAFKEIPDTGMVVTTDVADLKSLHPKKKLDIGKRLALWALNKTYGRKELICSGPFYKSLKINESKIRLSFDFVGGGLTSKNGEPLDWFTIAGADKKFVKADAVIDGDKIIVWSKTVEKPVAVRFGWSKMAQPNFYNAQSLPASPFRTDNW